MLEALHEVGEAVGITLVVVAVAYFAWFLASGDHRDQP